MTNAADPKKLREQEIADNKREELRASDMRYTMSDVRSRRVIAELLDFCGPFRSPFDMNGSKSNFNMGKQNVGLKIYADLENYCPDLMLIMRQESMNREENHA